MHGKFEHRRCVDAPRSEGTLSVLAGAAVSGLLLCASSAWAQGQDASAPAAGDAGPAVVVVPAPAESIAPSVAPAAPAPAVAVAARPAGSVKIASLKIDGGTVFTQRQMERAMGIGATSWLSWYLNDDDYSSTRLAQAVSKLRAFYISRGYLRITVREVKVVPSADRKTVAISLTVSEGRLYTLSSVKLGGDPDGLVGAAGVDAALQRTLPVGEPVTREGLSAARRALLAQLSHDGYPHAKVMPSIAIDDANGTVALTLAVNLGTQQSQSSAPTSAPTPAQASATPSSPARSSPVRQPGAAQSAPIAPLAGGSGAGAAQAAQAASGTASAASAAKAAGQGAKAGQSEAQPQAAMPSLTASGMLGGEVDIMGQPESQGMHLNVGVGYSTADRAFISGGMRYPDAFAKGWDANADIGFGRTFRQFQFGETDNRFTESGVSRGTSVWYRSDQPFYYLNGSHFRVSGAGVSERFDIPLSASDSISVAPGFEHDWLGGLYSSGTPVAYQNYVQRVGSTLNATTLRFGWTHDMRDSAAMPTSGYILQTGAELGIPALGARYIKLDASGRYYQPLWGDTVLSFSARGGYGTGWGSKGYPLEKYYYLGGPDSVRGYADNSLGPRDLATGYPIGGRRLLLGSVEMMQPISHSFVDQGRLVWLLFIDGGNVWGGLPGGSSEGARYSYGTGLGWQMPFGVLRVNFALPFKRHSGDDYQKFQLQFNAGF